MTVVKRAFVDGPYGQIHYRIARPLAAQKRPLVCLHMFPQSGRNFQEFVAAASSERAVVALDFPGYGESSPPPAPITTQDYAASIWVAIERLGLCDSHGTIDVFGIHAGSKLAAELVTQHPERVNRVVLASAAVLSKEELDHLKDVFTPIPLDEDGTRFKHLWDILTRNRGPETSLEMCATGLAEMLRGGEAYEWGHAAVFEYNREFPDVLRNLKHPVALLNPGDDLYDMTPRAMEFLPNAILIDRPDWHHGFLELHADEVAKLVNNWLDQDDSAHLESYQPAEKIL